MLLEPKGKFLGKGLKSLGAILSLPDGHMRNDTSEIDLELLEALRGQRALPHPTAL